MKGAKKVKNAILLSTAVSGATDSVVHSSDQKSIDASCPICRPCPDHAHYERVDWYSRRSSHRASARKCGHETRQARVFVRWVGDMNITIHTERCLLRDWVRGAGQDFDQRLEGINRT
jgi:hypothetical protein